MLVAVAGFGLASGQVLERQSFARAALGEGASYTIYLPAGYETDARSYPVIYMLHGYGGFDPDRVRYARMDQVADSLIADATLPPVIIVMPDGKNSWYVDSEVWGDYETVIARDLVQHVDATCRTIADRSSRLFFGLSMGGYGAAYLAFEHMHTFAAAGVMSGALYAEAMPAWPELVGDPADEERWAEHDVFELIQQVAATEERCGWPPPDSMRRTRQCRSAVMSMWGSRAPIRRLDAGRFHCPQCGGEEVYELVRAQQYTRAHVIPFVQKGEVVEYVECRRCHGRFDPGVLTQPPTRRDAFSVAFGSALMAAMSAVARAAVSRIARVMHTAPPNLEGSEGEVARG